MLDVRLTRTLVMISLSLPALTLLATWGDSADRVAQIHPAVLAATQLLASLTAMMSERAEREVVTVAARPDPRSLRKRFS